MQRTSQIITSILGALALLTWGHLYYQAYKTWSVPSGYIFVPCGLTVLTAVGWVVIAITAARGDHDTRCRKCRHILRGLSEPRCPECGSAI